MILVTEMDARQALRWTGLTVSEAAVRLQRLGFVVVNGSEPGEPGGANLIVALRDQPTLEHFDPELIAYWAAKGGRGRPIELARGALLPITTAFSWGTIRTVDRLDVFNSFLSFGGTLRAEAVQPGEAVAVFSSPAPIVRSAGHSQEPDPLAGEVGAFFARIRVPIDFTAGAEERISAASPLALYSVMLAGMVRRYAASDALRAAAGGLAGWSSREAARIRQAFTAEWDAGRTLAVDLGLTRS